MVEPIYHLGVDLTDPKEELTVKINGLIAVVYAMTMASSFVGNQQMLIIDVSRKVHVDDFTIFVALVFLRARNFFPSLCP